MLYTLHLHEKMNHIMIGSVDFNRRGLHPYNVPLFIYLDKLNVTNTLGRSGAKIHYLVYFAAFLQYPFKRGDFTHIFFLREGEPE